MTTDVRNPGPDSATHRNDARFDAAMRALHAQAVGQVPARLRWQLQPGSARMQRKTAKPAPLRAWRMPAAGALAALFAVAIGLGLRDPAPLSPSAAPATAAAGAPSDAADELAQDPDFYAWLASDDVGLVAME